MDIHKEEDNSGLKISLDVLQWISQQLINWKQFDSHST